MCPDCIRWTLTLLLLHALPVAHIQGKGRSVNLMNEKVTHWCYEEFTSNCGPNSWPGICNRGKFQSPINVVPQDVVGSPQIPIPVELSGAYCTPQKGFYVENNGHTIQVTLSRKSNAERSHSFSIEPGQAFPHKYEFAQLHLHWGPQSGQGSEHQINGKSYVMEMHMVHQRVPPSSTGSNRNKPQTPDLGYHDPELAVTSVFFQAGHGTINYALQPIIEAAIVANGTGAGDQKVYKRHLLSLYGLFPANKTVYQYQGSLTTPPCTQTVWWTLFEDPVRISHKQVETLLSLNDMAHKHITGNYREPQKLFGRKVHHRRLGFSMFCREEAGIYFERIASGVEP